MNRILLLVASPRLPAGLLTAQAWDLLRAHTVLTAAGNPQTAALRAAAVDVAVVSPTAETLLQAARAHGTVVWLAGPAGDADLARDLGLRLAREPGTAELELVYGSWDPPGARLLDVVTVIDRLASPGGDPWKRQQTHESLAKFLLEESYEAYDAMTTGDLGALREELGDLLLQVVLHARLAENQPDGQQWTVDDVAGDLVEKMVRRNPHVFGDASAETVDEVLVVWEQAKRAEKPRDSVLDGIPLSQPALALAAKVLSRVAAAGLDLPLPLLPMPSGGKAPTAGDELGAALLMTVARAQQDGLDAEAALRRTVLAYVDAIRADEQERRAR